MKTINAAKLEDRITAHAEKRISEGNLGCQEIIIKQQGETALHKRFGTFSTGGRQLPPDCMWRLASMTKPITAAAVLKQTEVGKIDLYKPVCEYLPKFENMYVGHPDEQGRAVKDRMAYGKVLVYQLLSHGSGIGSGDMAQAYTAELAQMKTLSEVVDFASGMPIAFDPGMGAAYSPLLALDVAARIVEVTSGMSFQEYLKKYIFEPLEMNDTTFIPTAEQLMRFPAVHARTEDGISYDDPNPEFDKSVFTGCKNERTAAGAGLAATAEDYSKFAQMLLNGGGNVLSERSVRIMSTPHIAENIMPGKERWGLGVRVITSPEYRHGLPVGSFGWSGAYGTHFWVDSENGITAVLMKNCTDDGGAGNRSACELEEDVMSSLE